MIDKDMKVKDINFDARSGAEDTINAIKGPLAAAGLGWMAIRGRKLYKAAKTLAGKAGLNPTIAAGDVLGKWAPEYRAMKSGASVNNFLTQSGRAQEAVKALGRASIRPGVTLGGAGLVLTGAGALAGKERADKRANDFPNKYPVELGKYYVVAQDRFGNMTLATRHPFSTKLQAKAEKEHLQDVSTDPNIIYSARSGDALLNYHGEYFYKK